MQPGPHQPSTRSRSRPGSRTSNRPLGVSIICIIGVIGVLLAFVPILRLVGLGGGAAVAGFVLLGLNVGQLIILVGLWNMSARALTWAYVFYGISLVLDILLLELLSAIISIVILAYLASVSDRFR